MPSGSIPKFQASPEEEIVRGAEFYRATLQRIHACLKPEVYLEIGVRHGFSLALSGAPVSVGVDPAPELQAPLRDAVEVVTAGSDAFFEAGAAALRGQAVDLAFIDGMHWIEFALRDFVNIERRARRGSVVVCDDILPNHPLQAQRERRSSVWTGDVWKIVPLLRRYRPDLELILLDTQPTGLLVISNLDPHNTVLRDHADAIARELAAIVDRVPDEAVLARAGAWHPADARFIDRLERLCAQRQSA